jgi:hypothetical protein
MTIASTDKEINELINDHHIYGLESIINAVVRACKDEPYVNEDYIIKLVKSAYDREELYESVLISG